MALPTTITGISTAIACVGPYKASKGLYFTTAYGIPTAANIKGAGGTEEAQGQSWSPTTDISLTGFSLRGLLKNGSPTDNIAIEVHSSSMSGSLLGTSDFIAGSSLTGSPTDTIFTFSTPVSLINGTTYYFAIVRSGTRDTTNFYTTGLSSTDGIASQSSYQLDNSSWVVNASSFDIGIKIYSSDVYYFFGRDSTNANTLQAYKATDPTSSFSSVASISTGILNTIQQIAGPDPASLANMATDRIPLIVCSETVITAVEYTFLHFDMSTDSFPINETIISGLNTENSSSAPQYGCAIVARSSSNMVAFFNGAQVANMGNSYAQTYYSRRTGVNTWSAAVQVSAGGQLDFTQPEAILGASDSIHFTYMTGSLATFNQRTLNSSNVLQTNGTVALAGGFGTTPYLWDGISYNNAGTQKVVVATNAITVAGQGSRDFYFDSGNTPTLNSVQFSTNSDGTATGRCFVDGTDVWILFQSNVDSDLHVKKSTDNGATWGTDTTAFVATVSQTTTNLSIDGLIFTRSSSVVIPYVVNDNGTLKYNEYVVRSITIVGKLIQVSQAVQRAAVW